MPAEHALQGFDGVRAYAADPAASRALLEETLNFEPSGDGWEARGAQARRDATPTTRRRSERGPAGRGHDPPRRLGVADIEEQEAWRERVIAGRRRGRPR